MNFIPYNPSNMEWTNHFTAINRRKNHDGLYVIKNKKQTGEGSLRIITPSEAVVRRVRQRVKTYKRKKKKQSKRGSGVKVKNKTVKKKAKSTKRRIKKKSNKKKVRR